MDLSPHNRLWTRDVDRLDRLFRGDNGTEQTVLRFIAARYGARSLFFLPPKVAEAAIERPRDFLRAARVYVQPELL